MSRAQRAATGLGGIAALISAGAALTSLTGGNRDALLFPSLLIATLLAAASAGLHLRRRPWPALAAAAAAALLLIWLPSSAHWTQVAIQQAAAPCPPFVFCKPQPGLSPEEAAGLARLTMLSLLAAVPAVLALAAGIFALPETSCRRRPAAIAAFGIAAAAAGLAAAAPWLAGGPPSGFDDRAAFFTVVLEMAAVASFLAAVAGWHGHPMLSASLGLGATLFLLLSIAGLPVTDWLISQLGQPQPCSGFYCPPAFSPAESTARLLMLFGALPAAALTAAGSVIDARERLLMNVRGQRVEHSL